MLTSEAAEQLKITKRSVARLCKRGIIKAELRGRDYWIEVAEVEKYKKSERRRGPKKTIHKSIIKEGAEPKQ